VTSEATDFPSPNLVLRNRALGFSFVATKIIAGFASSYNLTTRNCVRRTHDQSSRTSDQLHTSTFLKQTLLRSSILCLRRVAVPWVLTWINAAIDDLFIDAMFLWGACSSEASMDWNRIQGNWKQTQGKIREKWGKLTDNDLALIDGRREQLEGLLQERYGLAKDQVRKDVDAWLNSQP